MSAAIDSFRVSPIYPSCEFEADWSQSTNGLRIERSIKDAEEDLRVIRQEAEEHAGRRDSELREMYQRYRALQKKLDEYVSLLDELKELSHVLPDVEFRRHAFIHETEKKESRIEINLKRLKEARRIDREQYYRRELLRRAKNLTREGETIRQVVDKVAAEAEERLNRDE